MDCAMETDYNHENELTERDIWIDDIWKVLRELPRNAQVNIAMWSLDKLAKEQTAQQARKEAADRAAECYKDNCLNEYCVGCSDPKCAAIDSIRAAILGESK